MSDKHADFVKLLQYKSLQTDRNRTKAPTRGLKCSDLRHTVVPDRSSSHLHLKFDPFSLVELSFVAVFDLFHLGTDHAENDMGFLSRSEVKAENRLCSKLPDQWLGSKRWRRRKVRV